MGRHSVHISTCSILSSKTNHASIATLQQPLLMRNKILPVLSKGVAAPIRPAPRRKYATIEISFTESLRAIARVDDNPVINKLRQLPHLATASLVDSVPGKGLYALKMPRRVETRGRPPTRFVRTFAETSEWEFIPLPEHVMVWLHNYLHREICAPLSFQMPLPADWGEVCRHNITLRHAELVAKAKKTPPPQPQPKLPKPKTAAQKKAKRRWQFIRNMNYFPKKS